MANTHGRRRNLRRCYTPCYTDHAHLVVGRTPAAQMPCKGLGLGWCMSSLSTLDPKRPSINRSIIMEQSKGARTLTPSLRTRGMTVDQACLSTDLGVRSQGSPVEV